MSPNFFIDRPRFAFVISIVITLIGLLALVVMPVDQFPQLAPTKIVVRAAYPGADAQTIKDTVASPIEQQVNGAEGMTYMTSKAGSDGSYALVVTFEIGIDPDMAQVDVQNRVNLAQTSLPADVRSRGVSVKKRSPDMLMVVGLSSPDQRYDSIFLSNYGAISVVSELARVPGAGDVSVLGALDYSMRIWLDPVAMSNRNISTAQVIAALNEQNVQAAVGQLGAPPTGENTVTQYVLTAKGRLGTEAEFGNVILHADEDGSVTRIRDVGRIELGAATYKGYGELDNAPACLIGVNKLPEANALAVAEGIREKMEELSAYFPEGLEYSVCHDTTRFIEASLHETVLTLIFTVVLVIFVTYLFLGNLRATLVPTIAVPVSIIGTLAVLYFAGMTVNTVTLFALILAIGIVVDDAIIVVENVERILHENPGMTAKEATRVAMKEVTGPIVGATLVLAAVFIPTTLLPGMTGRLFGQFGITLVVAVLISMINAMTLSPALSSLILKPPTEGHKPNPLIRAFNAVFGRITGAYTALVGLLSRRLAVGLLCIVGFVALLVWLIPRLPQSFIPAEDKGFFIVSVSLPPGSSMNRTEKVLDQVGDLMKDDPVFTDVLTINGVSALQGGLFPNSGTIIAVLKPWDERKDPAEHQDAVIARYTARFAEMPEFNALIFGAPAMPGMGAVAGASFVLQDTQARGPDDLFAALQTMLQQTNASPTVARAFSTFNPGTPQIELEIDRVKAKTLGVSLSDVFLNLQTQLGGLYVNDFNLFGQTFRVMLQADAPFRQDEQALGRLHATNAMGEEVPLSAFITLKHGRGPEQLQRYNTYDSASISAVPKPGSSTGEVMAVMEEAIHELPPGYKFEWTDSSYEEKKSGNLAPIALGLALVFTYLFLAALYESFLTPVAVLMSVPFIVLGATLGLFLTGEPLSLYGQIALVLLLGLAAKTAILVVEFAKKLREEDGLSLTDATLKAAQLRFRPVMMTVVAFIVGVFPLVIATGAGAAGRRSLGIAIFSGTLVFAFLGTLFVPVLFRLVQGLRERLHGAGEKGG
ncbi:efflux RND transporter permease subunit [Luteolibacter marinus]|uniref:efflux RND transporter permease subunit n=1 Tax=Luteolibacter marinus TaxID=2776705 RepID=UPI001868DE77|nr:multidrug efflux RND transporter permease subunit [Luteolibacter marinus]